MPEQFRLTVMSLIAACGLAMISPAYAEIGRLSATNALISIDGATGGGLVPLATIGSLSERGQWGAQASMSRAQTDTYALNVLGVALGFGNRLELSWARQRFDISKLGLPISSLEQDVVGAKVRLAGDLIYDDLPQFTAGVQYRRLRDDTLPLLLGARDGSDVEAYLTVSRLFLNGPFKRNLLLSAGVRATRANQLGLLGYGGDRGNSHELVFEGAAALFLNPQWAIGAEYRGKSGNLSAAPEDDWTDLFIGYFPNPHLSVALARLNLGDIAGQTNERGYYLNVQATW